MYLAKGVFIEQKVLLKGMLCVHFLCPHKKRTKESGWGEALTARSFAAAVMDQLFFPNLEPPSPQTPTRPPSKERWES